MVKAAKLESSCCLLYKFGVEIKFRFLFKSSYACSTSSVSSVHYCFFSLHMDQTHDIIVANNINSDNILLILEIINTRYPLKTAMVKTSWEIICI